MKNGRSHTDNAYVNVDASVHIDQTADTTMANSMWTNPPVDSHDACVSRMDAFVAHLATKCPQVTSTDLCHAIACLPCCPSMLTAVRRAVDDLNASCDITRDAVVLSVQRYLEPHECASCPSYMCKGSSVDSIRSTNRVISHAARQVSGSVLVIFDYDWSLINENSDTFVFQKLYPELLLTLRGRLAKQPSWTKIMDDMLKDLAKDKPDTSSDMIRAAAACVPIQPHMLDALRLAAQQYSADVKIVSDANSVYIESMVQRHGLAQEVSEVITNPASFESLDNERNRLCVRPYHELNAEPHGCTWCPTNMCKGRIVDILRTARPYSSVLYVGDGSGDFCAATRLTKNDVVFARADEPDGKSYGLHHRIDSNPTLVEAAVVPWSTGDDIYRHFAHFFYVSLRQDED